MAISLAVDRFGKVSGATQSDFLGKSGSVFKS